MTPKMVLILLAMLALITILVIKIMTLLMLIMILMAWTMKAAAKKLMGLANMVELPDNLIEFI